METRLFEKRFGKGLEKQLSGRKEEGRRPEAEFSESCPTNNSGTLVRNQEQREKKSQSSIRAGGKEKILSLKTPGTKELIRLTR